jgi:hypothetical protein
VSSGLGVVGDDNAPSAQFEQRTSIDALLLREKEAGMRDNQYCPDLESEALSAAARSRERKHQPLA